MECHPLPTKKGRRNLLRAVTGLFKEKTVQPEGIVPQYPGPSGRREAEVARKLFRRRPKRQSEPSPSAPRSKIWDDPPPQYSLREITSQYPAPDSDPEHRSSDREALRQPRLRTQISENGAIYTTSPSPLLERLRYVDEIDAREPHRSPIQRRRSEPIEERPSQESEAIPTHVNTVFNTGLLEAATAVTRGATSRASRFSDGPYDLEVQQPVPIRPSPLSSPNLASSTNPLIRALYYGNAEQLEQAQHTKFDSDYAFALDLAAEEEEEEQGLNTNTSGREYQDSPEDIWMELDEHWALGGTRSCRICHGLLDVDDFPTFPPTPNCNHPNNTCAHCLRGWILSGLEVAGRAAAVTCPECQAPLSSDDARRAVLLHF